jgi:hypothetical protein
MHRREKELLERGEIRMWTYLSGGVAALIATRQTKRRATECQQGGDTHFRPISNACDIT